MEAYLEELCNQAHAMGHELGHNAATWYFDDRAGEEIYRHVLRGIEDGDPEVYDSFPGSPLSGEWADEPTPTSILAELTVEEDDEGVPDILDAFENGYNEGVEQEIVRTALAGLGFTLRSDGRIVARDTRVGAVPADERTVTMDEVLVS